MIVKSEILALCKLTIQTRIDSYKTRIKELKETLENLDSSGGDDDDDGSGELMAEYERYNNLKEEQESLKVELSNSGAGSSKTSVSDGALVVTNTHAFFIGISLGELSLENGKKFFAISSKAPIYNAMKGLTAGASFTFNDVSRTIESVS
jgi:hypothetical protein